MAGEVHWDYDGANGPLAWADLKPEFATCGSGKRQSPINIDESQTLRGPAEAISFDYQHQQRARVVNNGHTIQIDVTGDNGIIVRGSRFQLLQLHFHHPSEERINYRSFAMVAHLVHRNYLGQLAVVAVLLEPGRRQCGDQQLLDLHAAGHRATGSRCRAARSTSTACCPRTSATTSSWVR